MNIIVTGGSSGLGAHIIEALKIALTLEPHIIINWSLDQGVDVTDAASIDRAMFQLARVGARLQIDVLINCAGVNGIDFLPNVSEEMWDKVMDTNAKGIFLVSKALVASGAIRGGTIVNIVSNASHIPMTNSIAYNASKGAAAIMTRQMARELKKTHDITVFGISPNRMKDTAMSAYIDRRVQELRGWSAEEARAYQLASLPAGEETDPARVAEFIAFLLSSKERHKFLNGCDIPYGV